MTGPLHELLDQAAAAAPDSVALVRDDRELSYRQLAEESRRVAGWLRRRGVRRGDRVLLLLPNSVETVTVCYGASRVGAAFVVISSDMKAFHLRHVLADAAPALVVTDDPERLPEEHLGPVATVEDYRREVPSADEAGAWPGLTADPACLIYTSGSTAHPKGVVAPHRAMRFAVEAIGERLRLDPSDVIGVFLPLSFDYGLYQVFLAARARATLALGDPAQVGPGLPRRLGDLGVTVLPLVPSLADTLLRLRHRDRAAELPRLRVMTNTGARLAPETIDALRREFPLARVFAMFGLTECKRVSILDPADLDRKRGSVGTPLADTECLVLGPDGRPLPPGAVGELVVRGPHVMNGYWRAPEQTARRFRLIGGGNEVALFTGDLCSLDEDGYLYFHGRHDDVYKSRGHRVSTLEVETAARDIPGVGDAAVVPPANEEDEATLFVVGAVQAGAVIAALRERLEEAKVPPRVHVLPALPLNTNGKVDKHQLRSAMAGAGR